MRTLFAAGMMALAFLAGAAGAQAPSALAVGLEAQYRAARVRERRLADTRELALIAQAAAMREARRVHDAATGRTRGRYGGA
jgi:hypothetical protein